MNRNINLISMLFIMFSVLQGCGEPIAKGGPLQGRVLDINTDTPLSDVIVTAFWRGDVSSLVDSNSFCYHVESTITDAKGHFYIPAWKDQPAKYTISFQHSPYILVHKPGYQWPGNIRLIDWYKVVTGNWQLRENYYLTPAKGTRRERLQYLSRISSNFNCSWHRDIEMNLLLPYTAFYSEALNIIETTDYREIIDIKRVSVSEVVDDMATITGTIGASESEEIIIYNLGSQEKIDGLVNADGSFRLTLSAIAGDTLTLNVKDVYKNDIPGWRLTVPGTPPQQQPEDRQKSFPIRPKIPHPTRLDIPLTTQIDEKIIIPPENQTWRGMDLPYRKRSVKEQKRIVDEQRRIAAMKKEQEIIDGFLYDIERLVLGFDKASKRQLERRKAREGI